MSHSIGDADHITIETEDGEVYEFECNGFDVTIDTDYEHYGPGMINTKVVHISATLNGNIFCVKSPKN